MAFDIFMLIAIIVGFSFAKSHLKRLQLRTKELEWRIESLEKSIQQAPSPR